MVEEALEALRSDPPAIRQHKYWNGYQNGYTSSRDGHHRLRACKSPSAIVSRISLGRPLDELKYVVSVNLHRRHLDEFQRAEVALKYDKLYKKIARDRWESTKYTSESGTEAINKRWEKNRDADDGDYDNIATEIPPPSADGGGIGHKGSNTREELAEQFGVSSSTLDRVSTILD